MKKAKAPQKTGSIKLERITMASVPFIVGKEGFLYNSLAGDAVSAAIKNDTPPIKAYLNSCHSNGDVISRLKTFEHAGFTFSVIGPGSLYGVGIEFTGVNRPASYMKSSIIVDGVLKDITDSGAQGKIANYNDNWADSPWVDDLPLSAKSKDRDAWEVSPGNQIGFSFQDSSKTALAANSLDPGGLLSTVAITMHTAEKAFSRPKENLRSRSKNMGAGGDVYATKTEKNPLGLAVTQKDFFGMSLMVLVTPNQRKKIIQMNHSEIVSVILSPLQGGTGSSFIDFMR